jgi:hypothetical protein
MNILGSIFGSTVGEKKFRIPIKPFQWEANDPLAKPAACRGVHCKKSVFIRLPRRSFSEGGYSVARLDKGF